MTDPQPEMIESLVVADFGRGTSRAYLLEDVSGSFRFVAKAEHRTTADLPYEDISQGWRTLLRQLEWASGRGLTVRDKIAIPQLPSGDGVDGMLISSSLGEPIRVAVLEAGQTAVSPAVIDSLRRVNSRIFHVAAPAARKDNGWSATQADALRSFQPEMALLVIGAGSQDSMPRLLQLAKQMSMIGTVARAIVIADGSAQEQGVSSLGTKIKAAFDFTSRAITRRYCQRDRARGRRSVSVASACIGLRGDFRGCLACPDVSSARGRSGKSFHCARIQATGAHDRH